MRVIRDSDYNDMPAFIDDSSATSGDDGRSAPRPIARKKKVVLQVSGGKDVVISSAGDDNKSMGKLFAANLKVATNELAKSNSYALHLAEKGASGSFRRNFAAQALPQNL